MMKNRIIISLIILISLLFRFTGINWDKNTHLHPDERFLTMVLLDLKIPSSFNDYIDPKLSAFNPSNIHDDAGNKKYSFFVYGTLPLTLVKLASMITDNNTYNGITIIGRFISASLDLMLVFFLYKTIQLFEKYYNWNKKIKYWGAFFYSSAVLPIQLSHFFAVDTFLNTFIFISFYFSLKYYFEKKTHLLIFSAVFFGMAIASKITAIMVLPLLLLNICAANLKQLALEFNIKKIYSIFVSKKNFSAIILSIFLFFLASYFALRLSNPYMFENGFIFNPQINHNLSQSLKTLQSWNTKDVWYPPGVQWITKPPILFALYNLIVFGLGIPSFLCFIVGITVIFKDKKNVLLNAALFWMIFVFIYQSVQFVKSIRYFIILYPFICIIAAVGFMRIYKSIPGYLKIIPILIILAWPISFLSVYIKPHSRISASEWIYRNIPQGSKIAWELWDDPLPLRMAGFQFNYQHIELKVFDYDTPEKIQEFNKSLNNSDYYILSSNRAWASIPTVPEKYPFMTQFYSDLFNGKTKFKKVAEFTSYPSLKYLGIPLEIIDESSEEAFTVYDHPKVLIYKKN